MDALTLLGAAGLLWQFFEGRSRKRGLEPVQFSALDIEQFTSVETPTAMAGQLNAPERYRRFDADVTRGIARALKDRSARSVPPAELKLSEAMSVYEIVPPEMGLPIAADVLDHAGRTGLVVLGSLSFCGILTGEPWPILLVVGPPGTAEALAPAGTDPRTGGPRAQFARIFPPPSNVVEATAAPAVETPAPAPPSPAEVNGAAKHVPEQAQTVQAPEVASEE